MKNNTISNHTELELQIMHLKAEKFRQEDKLNHSVKELISSINPSSIVKGTLNEIMKDKELQLDAAQAGLNIGVNFVLEKLLGRNKSIRGFLTSMLVEKFSTSLISGNIPKIISGIKKLVSRKDSNPIESE